MTLKSRTAFSRVYEQTGLLTKKVMSNLIFLDVTVKYGAAFHDSGAEPSADDMYSCLSHNIKKCMAFSRVYEQTSLLTKKVKSNLIFLVIKFFKVAP
jgi:hypothetical protein